MGGSVYLNWLSIVHTSHILYFYTLFLDLLNFKFLVYSVFRNWLYTYHILFTPFVFGTFTLLFLFINCGMSVLNRVGSHYYTNVYPLNKTVNYTPWFEDYNVFDSSISQKQLPCCITTSFISFKFSLIWYGSLSNFVFTYQCGNQTTLRLYEFDMYDNVKTPSDVT